MKTILFDLDGTLIDSTEAILESFDVSFKHFGMTTPSDDEITSLVGHPLDIMYEMLGIDRQDVQSIVDVYKRHYRQISNQKTTLLPFAKESLEFSKQFATLGVVTTKTKRFSIELLEYMGILDYFSVIIGREDVQNPKPHAEPILKAISILKADTEKTWMIGDTPMDIISAKSAGVSSFGVTCGYATMQELKKYTTNIALNSLEATQKIKLVL